MTDNTPNSDFDFDAAAADFAPTPMSEVIRVIETAGRKVVLSPTGEEMVAVNESGEVSLYAALVEHNGEVGLTFQTTKHFAKFSNWAADADIAAYAERGAAGSCHRVYVTA